jgi:hypothetical protein
MPRPSNPTITEPVEDGDVLFEFQVDQEAEPSDLIAALAAYLLALVNRERRESDSACR